MTTDVIVNSQDVQRRLNNILMLVGRPKKLMGAIAATLHEETNENFATKGHGTWPALKHRDGEPLRDTSTLYNSITERSTDTGAELGTNLIYAAIHQFGGEINHPGGTRYTKTESGKARFEKNSLVGPVHGITGIHKINVPARPYFPIDENGNILPSALERVMEVLDVAAQNALK